MKTKLRIARVGKHTCQMIIGTGMEYDEDISFIDIGDTSILVSTEYSELNIISNIDMILHDGFRSPLSSKIDNILDLIKKSIDEDSISPKIVSAGTDRLTKSVQLVILNRLKMSELFGLNEIIETKGKYDIYNQYHRSLLNSINKNKYPILVAKKKLGARALGQFLINREESDIIDIDKRFIRENMNLNLNTKSEDGLKLSESIEKVNTISEYDLPQISTINECIDNVEEDEYNQLYDNIRKEFKHYHFEEFQENIIAEYRILGFYGLMDKCPGVYRVYSKDDDDVWSNLHPDKPNKNVFMDHEKLVEHIAELIDVPVEKIEEFVFDRLNKLMELTSNPSLNIDIYFYKQGDGIKMGVFEFQAEGAYTSVTDWGLMKKLFKQSLFNVYEAKLK